MDKSVVRESKFRHAYGKPWRKEACITNIQLGQVSGSNLIKANGLYIAVPWQSASGALAIIPLAQSGAWRTAARGRRRQLLTDGEYLRQGARSLPRDRRTSVLAVGL